ncbi:MAG: hypothetical protein ACRCUC_08405, partial [Aestuariivirga sp.]
ANTENALSQASERRTKAKAQMELADQLKAAKIDQARADAAVGALVSGGSLKDVGDMLAQQQEFGFREDAANPDIDFATGNRRLMGVANAPVERYASAGEGMLQDKFSNEAPTTSTVGEATIKAKEAQANRASGASKIYIIGNVPYMVGPDGALERKLTPEEVADNFGVTQSGKTAGQAAGKAEGDLPKAFQKYRNTTDNANTVMSKVDQALKDTSWISSGPLAWASRNTPGTPAFALEQAVLSIKANAGFQELSKMRHESPTGGALGNVTEKELEFLQGAIASLNTAQDPADLAKALADVRDGYSRYKEYAAQDYELAQEAAKYKPRAPAVVVPGTGASGPAAPASGAAPQAFDSEEAAAAAGLHDGTPVIINGV